MIYIPIIASLALATATIYEKIVLRSKGMTVKTFQTATFLAAVLVMIPLLYFFGGINYSQAFAMKNLIILFLILIISIIANLFLFYALRWEKVSVVEPAIIMEPLFTVILALIFSLFFGTQLYERNINVVIPALIAGIALIFAQVKKHHLVLNKYVLAALGGSFFFGLELVTSRLLLDFYTPLSFYFIRSLGVFLLSFLIFRPKLTGLKSKVKWQILFTGFLWVLFRVLVYTGYLSLGVIFTTLLVMLAPVFVFIFAKIFLKEKLRKQDIISSIVIIGAVLYAVLN